MIREEILDDSGDLKKNYLKYEKLINKLVYMVFDEGICGFDWHVFRIQTNPNKDIVVQIVLYFTYDSFKDLGWEKYHKLRKELKDVISNYLPKFSTVYVAYDTTKCEDTHKEEETEGAGGYAAPAFEMEPDHVHFKHLYNESIKRIIQEEITKKYPKPNEKLDKVVYKWLNNYFEGSQIYKSEYWKYHGFGFVFCKNGREIADLRVELDDRSPNWGPSDKRPTNERSVKEVMLYIYPVMMDELITDIPIRKNYLLYLIEEWFEDTQLDKIQQGFNRNDMSLDYVVEFTSNKKGDLCVPPPTKPEDMTMQEMMDYIKKTTLFSYKDMEEHEEDEPGWIEDTYLKKLHSKEQERVNKEDRENNPEPYDDDDDEY